MADLLSMLPTLDDALLANLHDNARRLAQAGTDRQRQAATEMLAAVEAECARRGAVANPTKPKKSRRKTPARRNDA
jgi:hypothetical protein